MTHPNTLHADLSDARPVHSIEFAEMNLAFVPFLFQWKTPGQAAQMFEGGVVPRPGDRIEIVCYAASEGECMARWRVVPAAPSEAAP